MQYLISLRTTLRKRGADMTQALLYAAFAIIVLISVLAMYQVVNLNHQKNVTMRAMTLFSSEVRMHMKATPSDQRGAFQRAMANLILPPDIQQYMVIGDMDFTNLTLPYQGSVTNMWTPGRTTAFTLAVTFQERSRGAVAMCTFLGSGDEENMINGPMGSDYKIVTVDCESTRPGGMYVQVDYNL